MAATVVATVKHNNNPLKTGMAQVSRVTRASTVVPMVKLNNVEVNDIKKSTQHTISLKSFSGLVNGDTLRAFIQPVGTESTARMELTEIKFVNGSECIWLFSIPSNWFGNVIIQIQHVNYADKVIGYKYYALKV
ncbi:hypothetical protein SHAb15599_00151 [Acinetobacter phage SH-Ab 15599]|nr:hypothetical protein SHAb15599_00151 [Acinetobacter phage SH-Ab 15599]